MLIKALKAFTDMSDGFLSVAHGEVVDLPEELATQLISEGHAQPVAQSITISNNTTQGVTFRGAVEFTDDGVCKAKAITVSAGATKNGNIPVGSTQYIFTIGSAAGPVKITGSNGVSSAAKLGAVGNNTYYLATVQKRNAVKLVINSEEDESDTK